MGKSRSRRAQRFEHLQLQAGVGDMILAAHDVGDAHVDIVDRARQHVEPAAVGAADDWVAEQGRIEMLGPADQVLPGDRRVVIELEAPVRPPPLRLERRAFGVAEVERGAIVRPAGGRGRAGPCA